MNRKERTEQKMQELFHSHAAGEEGTDPEFMQILQGYIFGDVCYTGSLDNRMRELVTVTALTVLGTLPQLKAHVQASLNAGCSPVEIRETVYQCAPFIGFPKTLNAISAMNEVFADNGIQLPLPKQSTLSSDAQRYTALCDVDIMDENGSMTLPVTGGSNLTENYVGANFANYDYYIVLSHFKGHSMAGYGGAIKNISIGIASSEGKAHIHSGGTGGSMWGGDQDAFLESMAEAGKSVVDYLDGNILYINVMNRLSVDCDCDGNPAEPDMHDIGILASFDPVALDQACVDLVYAAEDGDSLVQRIESRNGLHTLEHAEAIGLGSRSYELVRIDS